MAQANAILAAETRTSPDALLTGLPGSALRQLDSIHDRLESPAARMLRTVAPRSSYVVLPIFALANSGVTLRWDVFQTHGPLIGAIMGALIIGKPLGFFAACWIATKTGLAEKPTAYSSHQLAAAGALAGIGFTMSLFIAGQAFPDPGDFAAAKIAVFAASAMAALVGMALFWKSGRPKA
jgi:NhaA family Na+:H+ antiporter